MPTAERGWIAVDVRDVLNLDRREVERLVDTIIGLGRSILVTSPTIVYVENNYSSLAVTLGVGSLIIEPKFADTLPGIRAFRLFRREWIDGCWIEKEPRYILVKSHRREEVQGTSRALKLDDPVALLSNGIKDTYSIAIEDVRGDFYPIVLVKDRKVVFKGSEGYISLVHEGRLREILDYIAPLASACRGPSP